MLKLGRYWRDCGGQVAQPAVAARVLRLAKQWDPLSVLRRTSGKSAGLPRMGMLRGSAWYQRGRRVAGELKRPEVDRAVPSFLVIDKRKWTRAWKSVADMVI